MLGCYDKIGEQRVKLNVIEKNVRNKNPNKSMTNGFWWMTDRQTRQTELVD